MNYEKHYALLIAKAKSRILDNVYYELHHIIPRCMNGTNDVENLVKLLPEEHYLAHLLLVKIHPNNNKLIYAANMMAMGHKGKRNNKIYAWLKIKVNSALRKDRLGFKHTEETKAKMSKSRLGKPKPNGFGDKIAASNSRRIVTEETKAKLSKACTGKITSEETKVKQSIAHSGSNNSMYGKKGKDHPAYGLRPWETGFNAYDKSDWCFAHIIYSWYEASTKTGTRKKYGHKLFIKEVNPNMKNQEKSRGCLDKIKAGWVPILDENWKSFVKRTHPDSYEFYFT